MKRFSDQAENILDFIITISLIVLHTNNINVNYKMKSRILQFSIAALCILISYCRRDSRSHLPAEQETFVNVYIGLLKLRESFPENHPDLLDSTRKILQGYHFTKDKYEQCLAYFNEEPERWEAFYQEVLERLKEDDPSTPPHPNPSQTTNNSP